MMCAKSKLRKKKTSSWTLPTILGLAIGAVGALGVVGIIELRPQIAVSPQESIEKSQPFLTPFRIDNTGYLSFHINRVICYAREVTVGSIDMGDNISTNSEWDNHEIDRADGETVICKFVRFGSMPSATDMAVVVDYSAPFMALSPPRRYFRFKGAYVDNWQWTKQPADEEFRKSADSTIARMNN
jgi:hypothetical protein